MLVHSHHLYKSLAIPHWMLTLLPILHVGGLERGREIREQQFLNRSMCVAQQSIENRKRCGKVAGWE